MLKVITVIGTRPEIIKLSQIIKLFDQSVNISLFIQVRIMIMN